MILLYILATFISFFQPLDDTFYVIHLKGSITNKTTGKVIKVGDKLNAKDHLKFDAADALAVVVSPEKGKFTIKPNPVKDSNNEFMAFIQSAILPMKTNSHLSTRGGESDGIMDMKTYFGTEKFAIIGDKYSIKLNAAKYPLSDTRFFIYRYMNKDVPVSKKIEHDADHLTFDKQALYLIDGQVIDPSSIQLVDIYYYDSNTRNSTKVASFSPVFIPENILNTECKIQRELYKSLNRTREEIDMELHNFVKDVYGKTDDDVLEKWIKTNHAD
jgi:hypothetical protein